MRPEYMNDDLSPDEVVYDEEVAETVENMRRRLNDMKRIIEEQSEAQEERQRRAASESIIDGKFLSIMFTTVLILIIIVSCYAFLNLYHAILKKFPSHPHTEL